MLQEDKRELSESYFSKERLAEHHFRSYNAFLEHGMQDVVTEKERIETDIGDKEDEEPVWVELGDVRAVTPRVRRPTAARSRCTHRKRGCGTSRTRRPCSWR